MIPTELRQLLSASPLEGPTLTLVDAYTTVLVDNKTPFFPYYTDHGLTHVSRVMDACVRLVPPEVWEREDLLTHADAAVLVCACLLHDVAMHVREHGFLELVSDAEKTPPVPWFSSCHGIRDSDDSWPKLWESFMREARHFGRSQLDRLLGPDTEGVPAAAYGETDPTRWTTADRLLIGEFLRRHHARLSHEIALFGFPGARDHLPLPPPDIAHAAGVVARSHGESLRLMVTYLEDTYGGNLRPTGAALMYLMGLLRVADYLQLDADRAPAPLLRLKRPESRQTLEEWNKHGSVSVISRYGKDPLGIHIEVTAEHALRTHLALRELFAGLEAEFSATTAILSETYRGTPLDALRLSRQRIHTNLNSPALHESLAFVPRRTALRSDEDLVRLVIDDLYGKEPAVAVRELLQNAVDAVRERRRHDLATGQAASHEVNEPQVIVEVEETPTGHNFRITDCGIGMTASTVADYFLTAGASFGPTSAEREGLSHADSIRTTKAGRFGVGAFAPFLLGPRYHVRTRHVEDMRGLEFTADIDEDLVELKWVTGVPSGTEVIVPLSPDRLIGDPFNLVEKAAIFYALDTPTVEFREVKPDGAVKVISQPRLVPSPDVSVPAAWRCFSPEGFDAVYWTPRSRGQSFVHNGFSVRNSSEEPRLPRWSSEAASRVLAMPEMAVFDPRPEVRLTLHRYDLAAPSLPFEKELLREIGVDIVAFALTHGRERAYPLARQGALGSVYMPAGWFPATPGLISRILEGHLLVVGTSVDESCLGALCDLPTFAGAVVAPLNEYRDWIGSWLAELSRRPVPLRISLTDAGREAKRRAEARVMREMGLRVERDEVGLRAVSIPAESEWQAIHDGPRWRCGIFKGDACVSDELRRDLVAAAKTVMDRPAEAYEFLPDDFLLWAVPLDRKVALEPWVEPWMEHLGAPLPQDRLSADLLLTDSDELITLRDRRWGPTGDRRYD